MFRWLEKRESGGDEVLVSATKTRCETPPDYKDAQIKKVNNKVNKVILFYSIPYYQVNPARLSCSHSGVLPPSSSSVPTPDAVSRLSIEPGDSQVVFEGDQLGMRCQLNAKDSSVKVYKAHRI